MKKLLMIAITFLFVAGISTTAKAVSLVPGGSVSPVGTFVLPGDAVEVASITNVPFTGLDVSSNIVFSGTLTQKVYSDSLGMLFEYTFSNTNWNGGTDAIAHLATSSFAGWTTNVDATGVDVSPLSITRSSGSGSVVDFNFDGVANGSTSDALWIQTNAQGYKIGSTAIQDGGNTNVRTYAPATPEPATMAMFGMGVLGLFGLRKRKLA